MGAISALVCASCLPGGGSLRAQVSGTFTGLGTAWSDAASWSSARVLGVDSEYDAAKFDDAVGGLDTSRLFTVDGLIMLNQLTITAGLNQTLTLTDGGVAGRGFHFGDTGAEISLLGNASLVVDSDAFFDAPATITNQLGILTFNAGKVFSLGGNDLTIDAISDGASIRLLSNITGDAASLTKIGTGELRLTGSNTFTGGVNLYGGRLLIDNDRALGTGTFTIGDGVTPASVVTIALTASHKIDNQLVWNNDLAVVNAGVATIKTLSLDATGTVTLAGERKLELSDYVTVRMGDGLALQGAGGLYVYGNVAGGMEFRNAHSTFEGGYRQGLKSATVGTGSNNITLGALVDGENYIGSGSVAVSGTFFTLTLNPGAQYTTNLRGSITLDWGAILDIVSGTTVLDGATLADLNPDHENRFIFRGDTIFTDATFVNSPILHFTAAAGRTLKIGGAGMGAGVDRIILDGSGTVALAADAANIGAGLIRLDTGALILGANNQIRADSALYLGDGVTLRTGGYSADFTGGLGWGDTGSRIIDLGGGGGSGSVLDFGAASLGGSGTVYVQNWKDGADQLLFSNDITSAPWRNNVRFDGYNWGMGVAVIGAGAPYELIPALGAMAGSGTYEWTGSASFSTGASSTNMWNAPGNWDINRIPEFGAGTTMVFGNKYATTPTLTLNNVTTGIPGGVLTVGKILFNRTNTNYAPVINSGTIIMNSGVVGVSATIAKSYYDYNGAISSVIQLDSNLVLDRTDANTPSGSYYRTISGTIRDGVSGTSITINQGAWYLSNVNNTFTGGITLNGGLLWLASSGTSNALGKGALTLKGGVLQGYSIYNSTTFAGNFAISSPGSAGYTHFYSTIPSANNAADIIWMNSNVTITGTMSTTYGWGSWAGLQFHEGRNIQGAGGLTIAGVWDSLYTYAANSTFSGGFNFNSSSAMYVRGDTSTVGNGSLVFGTTSPGANYLGISNITQTAGTIYAYGKTTGTAAFLNGVTTTLTGGSFYVYSATTLFAENSSLRMTSGGFIANNGVILSNMNLSGYGSVGSGGALQVTGGNLIIGNVNVSSYPNITLTGSVNILAESGGTSLLNLGVLSKNTTLTTSRIDTSITQLGAGRYTINSGRLQFTRDNQVAGAADLYLYATGIIDSSGVKNTFGRLYINGASTMELGTGGELTFSGLSSWGNTAGVLYLLNIQNTSGAWSTFSGATPITSGDDHVWFSSTAGFTGAMLNNVAFTGYTRGAAFHLDSSISKYELTPSGEKGFEWSGAGGNNYWGTGGDWFGGVAPGATAGDIAIFRDADAAISGTTITLNGSPTVGKIFFEATTGASFTIGGAAGQALTFDNTGSQSVIYFGGASTPTISANMILADSLLVDHQAYGRTLTLSGTISGTSGIKFTVDPAALANSNNTGYYLTISGNAPNTFEGGFEQQGGYLYLYKEGALGTGTYTITGTATIYSNSTARTLANPLMLNGGLYMAGNTLTFKNNAGLITDGMKNIYVGSGNLVFDSDYTLTGGGGLNIGSASIVSTSYQLVMRGQNIFTGGVSLNRGGAVMLGASSVVSGDQIVSGPLGTGTFTIGNGGVYVENSALSYTLHNPLAMGTGYNTTYLGRAASGVVGSGTLIFDSVEDFKLNAGANTFYAMGARIDFATPITNAANGSAASLVFRPYSTSSYAGFIRLSGSNSYTGGTQLYGSTSGNTYMTLSLANDYALGTGALTLNNYYITLETFGPNRTINNLINFNNTSGYYTYFTATNGATSLFLGATGNSTLGGAYYYWDVANGMTVTFGAAHNLIGTSSTLTKQGGGELELLAPRSTFNGLIINAGTVSTTLLEGHDMVLGASGTGAQDNYFGTGMLTISGLGAVARIDTWVDGDDAGEVIVRGGLSVSNGGRLDIRGGGNLVFAYTGTVTTGASSGTIAIGDGGWLVKDGANTLTALDASIVAPILIRGGTLSLVRANLLSNASGLTMTGSGALMLNGLNQTLSGNWSLTGAATLDFGNKGLPLESTLFTVTDFGTWDLNSTLLVTNWHGELAVGNGNSQIIINNYTGSAQFVPNVWFVGSGPGAYVLRRENNVVELVPYADTCRWEGNTDPNWSVKENWYLHRPPNTIGLSVSFGDAASTTAPSGTNINLDSDKRIGSLVFEGTRGQRFNFSGAGSIIFDIAETEKAKGVVGQIVMAENNHATINGPVELDVDLLINNLANSSLEINGSVYKSGGNYKLVKRGEGSLTLSSAANTFDGMFLEGGLLRINAGELLNPQGYITQGPLGVGALTISGGAIEAFNANRTVSNRIILDGGFTVSGANTLTFAYDSTVIPGAQKSIINSASAAINVADAAGKLVITATNTLAGTGMLIKDGAGTLELQGPNEYAGGTEIRQGTLAVSDALSMNTQDVVITGNSTLRLDAAALDIANAFDIHPGVTGTINTQTHTGTLSGIITGDGGLAKAGSGTLTLASANSYTGNTSIDAGALIATDAAALSAGAVNVAASAKAGLAFNNATVDNTFTGAGETVVTGTALRLTADNTGFTGTWTVDGSALASSPANLGANSAVIIGGTLTADGEDDFTFASKLGGAGVLNFDATGANRFGPAAGTYVPGFTGRVNANAGTLFWDANANAVLASATLALNGGLLDITTGLQTSLGLTVSGGTMAFTGTAGVTDFAITGSANIVFDHAVMQTAPLLQQDEGSGRAYVIAQNWDGDISNLHLVTAAGDRIDISSTLAIGADTEAYGIYSNTLTSSGGTLGVAYRLTELQLQADKILTLAGDTTPPSGGDELHALISGEGSLRIAAANAITLNTVETYTGTTFTATGTLMAGVADVIASSTALVNDAVFDMNGRNQQVGSLSGSGAILIGNNTLTVNEAAGTTYSGILAGAGGALVKNGDGALALTGSNTYTGATTINAGEIQIGDGGTAGHIVAIDNAANTVTIGANAAFAINRGDTVAFKGAITGSGTLVQRGGGLLLFEREQNHTGGTIIESGTLKIQGDGAVGTSGQTVDIRDGGVFHIGDKGDQYNLMNKILGTGTMIVDIAENSAGGSTPYSFAFSYSTDTQAANFGQDFHGTTEMRNTAYTINNRTSSFLSAGDSSLRTTAGSVGSIASRSTLPNVADRYWDLGAGGLIFAGGRMTWNFDSNNDPLAWLKVGSISIASNATTTFALNLSQNVAAPTIDNTTDGTSLFVQNNGSAILKLAESASVIDGPYNNLALEIYVNNVLQPSAATQQIVDHDSIAVAQGTFDWAAYSGTIVSGHELKVGYKLIKLEVYGGKTLDLVRIGDDVSEFSALITDMAGNTNPSLNGPGNVRFDDASDAADGIRLSSMNSYTGTSFIYSGTVLAGADNALGYTTDLVISATGAFNANAHNQTVGQIHTTAGGRLDLTAGSILAISDTQRAAGVTDGGLLANNALFGGGLLVIDPSTLLVDGAQAGFTGTLQVTGSSTLVLNTASAFDNAHSITLATSDDTLVFGSHATHGGVSAATPFGAASVALQGSGTIRLIDSATVTFAGDNTGLLAGSAFDIANGSRMTVSAAQNLGSANIRADGQFAVDTSTDWQMDATLSGSGALLKQGSGTLTLAQANNAFVGTTTISAGALQLQNYSATGTGNIANNAILDLAAAGAFDSNIDGSGTTRVSHGSYGSSPSYVLLTGSNQTAWHILGVAQVTGTANLGSGSVDLDGGYLILNSASWNFTNALTGDGTLIANFAAPTGTFAFAATAGSAFEGILDMQSGVFDLSAAGAAALTNGTLKLSADGSTTLDANRAIHGLTMNQGTLRIVLNPALAPTGTLTVSDLAVANGGTLAVNLVTSITATVPATLSNFYNYSNDASTAQTQVVVATGAVDAPGTQLDWTRFDGSSLGDGSRSVLDIIEGAATTGTAIFDYVATVREDGIWLGFGLSEIIASTGTAVSIDNTGATGGTLGAKLTGDGGFTFTGTGIMNVGNASSSYTGTTTLATGTLRAATDNALGLTSWLFSDTSAAYDLNGNAQTIGGGRIGGALLGSGSLGLAGYVEITSTNAAFSADAGVTGTTILHNAQALGSGAVDVAGELIFSAATGANTNAISGAGLVTATNAANITLDGANTAFTGTWQIAAASALKSVSADSLGAGSIANTGTLIVGASLATPSASYTLNTANAITGPGSLVKEDTNTVTIARANTFTGDTFINAGELSLAHAGALGTGTVHNSATLRLDAAGVFANNTTGTGRNIISGVGVTVFGTNTQFTGTWDITGSGTMIAQRNLGASGTTAIDIASGGDLALLNMGGNFTFNQQLTGAGRLLVANYGAFGFGSDTGAAFTGTVTMQSYRFTLDAANAAPLANATLEIADGNHTAVAAGTHDIGNLALTGGTMQFTLAANGSSAAGAINTNTLAIGDTVIMVNASGIGDGGLVLLQQDEGANIRLVSSATLAQGSKTVISGTQLVDQNGLEFDAASQRDIVQATDTVASATYNFAATASNSGLYLSYALTHLELLEGKTTILDGDKATPLGADELHAIISGGGNLQITATGAITLNAENTYTGTTFITTGTLIAGADNALGHTSWLSSGNQTTYDLSSYNQTIGGGRIDGALLGSGSLGLAGYVEITSANAAFAADTGITGTTVLHNTQALGGAGIATIAGNAELLLRSATGALAKSLAGSGLVTATNAANVTLEGNNAAFTGTWQIASASALKATSADSLGTGEITNSGALIIGASLAAPSAAYTLNTANTITGSGALLKEDANTVTLAHANNYTGGSVITAGTLRLENLAATGTGSILNNASLDLAATGIFANNISGSGTTHVSHGAYGSYVVLTGSNQTAWRILGAAQAAAAGNIGDGAVRIAAGGLLELIGMGGDYTFGNALTGDGALLLANTGALAFDATTGTAFTGTVTLRDNAFTLAGATLANATLVISENNRTAVAAGIQRAGNLALESGTIAFTLDATGTAAAGVISTGTLALSGSTVVIVDTGSFNHLLPLLQQDDGRDIELIAATAHTGATLVDGASLIDQNGDRITDATQRDITRDNIITASGTYDFSAIVSGSGMRLGYNLVALDLLSGQTTVLDNDSTLVVGGTDMHARISGDGSLLIDATDAIYLNNGNNTYTGATLVTGGILVAGNSGALGNTSLLSIAPAAAADLNGTAQTIGALDNNGSLHFSGGALTIRNGGTSTGALTGAGALNLAAGNLLVSDANPSLVLATNIAASATATLNHASALGDSGDILIDGLLALDIESPAAQTLAPSLSGSGSLVKTNTGAVTIPAANPGFAGSAHVENGLLTLENLAALAAAPIVVDASATLEYRNVDGVLANTVNGSGTLRIAHGALAVEHDNTIANTTLDNALVYISATQALGPDTAAIRAVADSAILFRIDGARLGHVTLDSARLGFAHDTPAFHRATLASLSGSNATLIFNTDFTNVSSLKQPGEVSDHLTIAGGSAGAFTVHVNPLGGLPTSDETAIPLITDANGSALYQLDSGKLEFGLTEYSLGNGSSAESTLALDPRTWYLYTSGLSQVADAIIDTAALLAKDWHYSLDALYLRMGDIRNENLAAPGNPQSGNLWLRSRAYQLNATNPITGRAMRQYAYGVSAGADKAFGTQSGVNLLGAFLDMGRITREFGAGSDGATNSLSAGLYATLLKNNGWHADFVVKTDRYRHNLDISTVTGRPVRGSYTTLAYGASIELGRRLERANGWWVEPAVQAARVWLDGARYRTTPDNAAIDVKVDDTAAAQYRGLVRFGRRLKDTRWTPYGKFGLAKTDTDGGAIHAHNNDFEPDFDSWRVEFGLGTSYRIDASSQVYFDYEYGKAAAYERPWSFNLGYRRLW